MILAGALLCVLIIAGILGGWTRSTGAENLGIALGNYTFAAGSILVLMTLGGLNLLTTAAILAAWYSFTSHLSNAYMHAIIRRITTDTQSEAQNDTMML